MKYYFTLPDVSDAIFELDQNLWTGKAELSCDEIPVERSAKKEKPFLIKTNDGAVVEAILKNSFPDMTLILEIAGKKYPITRKLQWYEYIIGGLPLLLVFIGGLLGGAIGGGCTVVNYMILRGGGSQISKYLKVAGIIVACYCAYFLITSLFLNLF